jgi:hypothetical protein
MNLVHLFAFLIAGIIIDLILLNIVIPYVFPNIYKHKKMKNKLETTIMSVPLTLGKCALSSSSTQLNTSNPWKSKYIHAPHSNNLAGGAQYSYSFWLDMKSDFEDTLDFFIKGSNKKISYDRRPADYFIASPLVRFNDKNNFMTVRFNTLNNPITEIHLDENFFNLTKSTPTNPRWFLFVLVFSDYFDFKNQEKGIEFKCYVNTDLVVSKTIRNDALKLNSGDVFITPSGSTAERNLNYYADLTYHNYALNVIDVENIYSNGVNVENGCQISEYAESGSKEIAYSKLSMYNYLNPN